MSLASRKEERAVLVTLLESDAYVNADKLADAVFKASFRLIQKRSLVGVRWDGPGGQLAVGPFPSEEDATRWFEALGGYGGAVCRLVGPKSHSWSDGTGTAGKLICGDCGHPKGAHSHPKQAGRCMAAFDVKAKRHGCDCRAFKEDK